MSGARTTLTSEKYRAFYSLLCRRSVVNLSPDALIQGTCYLIWPDKCEKLFFTYNWFDSLLVFTSEHYKSGGLIRGLIRDCYNFNIYITYRSLPILEIRRCELLLFELERKWSGDQLSRLKRCVTGNYLYIYLWSLIANHSICCFITVPQSVPPSKSDQIVVQTLLKAQYLCFHQ